MGISRAMSSWPSNDEIEEVKRKAVEMMSGRGGYVNEEVEVRVAVSPYRICPLGAHIDHQGGTVSAMTINRGILLGFIPSKDSQVILRSGQFKGEVTFSQHLESGKKGERPGVPAV